MSFGTSDPIAAAEVSKAVGHPNKEIVPQFSRAKPQVIRLTTMLQLNELRARCKDKLLIILFWALWYPECEDIRQEMERLAPSMSHLKLCWADVDKDREIVDEYEIYQVPYVLLQHPHKEELEQIRSPSVKAIGKVLVAYQEIYLRLFKSERKKAFHEI